MFIVGLGLLILAACSSDSNDSHTATWTDPATGMEFVWVPSGEFTMGSPDAETPKYYDEKPQHGVTVSKGFWLGKYEVTQGQWKKVMGSNPAWFNLGDDYPVEVVSWKDCQDFITRLETLSPGNDFSLPTEAQWEYACRGGTGTTFYTGACIAADHANYDGNFPYSDCPSGEYRNQTAPVGSFSPNAFGLYDMAGNVWEWCQDWYDVSYYANSPRVDPLCENSKSAKRVIRGGSWLNWAKSCRSAYRSKAGSDFQYYSVGFRLVRLASQ